MEEKTLFDIFKIAIDNERDAHAFYRKAAKGTSDPGLKKLFRELADTELDHERRPGERYKEL